MCVWFYQLELYQFYCFPHKDLEEIEYNCPIVGAKIVSELLGDDVSAKILDCAAGTGLVAEEVSVSQLI